MIENYLIQIGMKCGTVSNFANMIVQDSERDDCQHWYFLTPIKAKVNASGLKEATINLAFPFVALPDDVNELDVIERLSEYISDYETELLFVLRKRLIVAPFTISVVPFWSNKYTERIKLENFGNVKVHILSAIITVKYREHWI